LNSKILSPIARRSVWFYQNALYTSCWYNQNTFFSVDRLKFKIKSICS